MLYSHVWNCEPLRSLLKLNYLVCFFIDIIIIRNLTYNIYIANEIYIFVGFD